MIVALNAIYANAYKEAWKKIQDFNGVYEVYQTQLNMR